MEKSQRKDLNIPLEEELNNLDSRTVGHRKRKKTKKLNVTQPAESEVIVENEIKKPKGHNWEELGHDNKEIKSGSDTKKILAGYRLSVMGTTQSGWDVSGSHSSTTQGSERNDSPVDGNNKNGVKGEGRRKHSSSNSCTVSNNIQGHSRQGITGSPSVGGNGGNDGEDEDDRDRQPKQWSTCSKDVCLNLDEEEEKESESQQIGVDATAENLYNADKGQFDVTADTKETCQIVASKVSPTSGGHCISKSHTGSCQSLPKELERSKSSNENQGESESAQRDAAGESLHNQSSLEEDNAVALNEGLKSVFQCRRNLCSDSAWAACEDSKCQELHAMMTHSNKCKKRILGGCQMCIVYFRLLYYHASRCSDVECTVSRCDYIKIHIAELQALPARQWSRKLDQVFFSSVPPLSPSSPTTPVDVSTLFPDASPAISGEEALQDAHIYLCSAERNKATRMHPSFRNTSRHYPGMTPEQLLFDLPMEDQEVEASSPKVGSSNYLHDFSAEPDVQTGWSVYHVDRPPDLPLPELACSMHSSSDETGVKDIVGFTVNSKINDNSRHIPLIEDSRTQSIDLLCRSSGCSEHKDAAGQHSQGVHEIPEEPEPHVKAEAVPLSCRGSSSISAAKQPIAVKEITVQNSEKLEYVVPVGLAYQTADHAQHQSSVKAAQFQSVQLHTRGITHRQKDHGDEEILWPLDTDHLSVVDGRYDENVHWFSSNDWYLGGGANGRCYFGTDHRMGLNFAIKRIPFEKFEMSELLIWGKLSGGPNILKLYGAVRKGKCVIIFMELMEGGSLEDLLDQEDSGYGGSESSSDDSAPVSRFPQEQAMYIMREVLEGMQFMHSLRIMHRDLKGGNILLDATGLKVRIADFGEAIQLNDRESQQDNVPRGTEAFMAPEVCRSENHSFSADIWSLMCTLYQMLVKQPPWMSFRHGSILFQIAMALSPPELPPCSALVQDFFEQGFKLNACERSTAVDLLRHPALELGTAAVGDTSGGRSDSLGYSTEPELDDLTSSDGDLSLAAEKSVEHFVGEIPSEAKNDFLSYTGSEGSASSSEAMALVHDLLQGDRRDQSKSTLSLEEELNQQSSGHLPSASCENWNEDELLSDSEEEAFEKEGAVSSGPALHPKAFRQTSVDWTSFSMTDLTKVHVLCPGGDLICTIRESATRSYGELAQMLHGTVASMTGLQNFALVRSDGAPLEANAELGSQEQWLRVLPAPDSGWRVDQHGMIEYNSDLI